MILKCLVINKVEHFIIIVMILLTLLASYYILSFITFAVAGIIILLASMTKFVTTGLI